LNDREVLRAVLAAVAMHALLQQHALENTETVARAALGFADALLAALEKKPT
jgi:hypothetical protein